MKNKTIKKNTLKNFKVESKIEIDKTLLYLIEKRIGGVVNLRGVGFQLLYAIYIILKNLNENENNWVQLEAIEDIDLYLQNESHFIQVKTSTNNIDAGQLWDLNVLQNFLEVKRINNNAQFVLAHNTFLTKGNLDAIKQSFVNDIQLEFWKAKFEKSNISVTDIEIVELFKNIKVDKKTESDLLLEIRKILIERYSINNETELTFLKSLFYFVFESSKQKKRILFSDINLQIQTIKDDYSKFPSNPAIANNWVCPILFNVPTDTIDTGYYDGKSANPIDIAMDLPIKREVWQKLILEGVLNFDITVIKSSSGQGKSTLAWQVSKILLSQNYDIYQLQYCPSWNEVNSIVDFLETRIKVGETPIVVIDGLINILEGWNLLADKLKNKTVKFIVTSREEDWIRFRGETTNLTLKIIDIKLTELEAKDIFLKLKKNEKLHSNVNDWQPAWEKIRDKGLLIEYVYLLTQGQMIVDRLKFQIQKLSKETSSGVKLEILRLVTLGDILGVKLNAVDISKYIRKNFKTDIDFNVIYGQLEKEYYLQFDKRYIEGLHPVRSRHLIKILHSNIEIEESLLNLLVNVKEDFIYDYFIGLGVEFKELNKDFFEKVVDIMVNRKIPELVFAIDGLMHNEPNNYWQKNKKVFDEAFETGGIEFFIMETVPYGKLNTIEKLINEMDESKTNNLNFLLSQLKLLSYYSLKESNVYQFVYFLSNKLNKDLHVSNLEGIGFLYKWFKRLEISFPDIVKIKNDELLEILETEHIDNSSELFNFFYNKHPKDYKNFVDTNLKKIIGLLKVKTNSLSIFEKDNELFIEYLLYKNGEDANAMSVYKINKAFSILPFYNQYNTSAIILPFPNGDIYKAVLENAHKRMPKKNIVDSFDVHLNQIWLNSILNQYSTSSAFEWQRQMFNLRNKIAAIINRLIYFFEAHIENSQGKITKKFKHILPAVDEILLLIRCLRKYPSYSVKYFEKNTFTIEENEMNTWYASIRNFFNQMNGICSESENQDKRLAVINLNSAVYNLKNMQNAFEEIAKSTSQYFDTSTLIKEEDKLLNRLLKTIKFYLYKMANNVHVIMASKNVLDWWETNQRKMLEGLYYVLMNFQKTSKFIFHLPSEIIYKEYLSECVIGVSRFNASNDDDFWELSMGLRNLSRLNIDNFILLFVDNKNQTSGGLKVSSEYLSRFRKHIDNEEYEMIKWDNPLPVFPDVQLLSYLENIILKPKININDNEPFFRMFFNCWKLSEYRRRLDKEDVNEILWLNENEEKYKQAIIHDFDSVQSNSDIKKYQELIRQFLKKEIDFTKEEIVEYMIEESLILATT